MINAKEIISFIEGYPADLSNTQEKLELTVTKYLTSTIETITGKDQWKTKIETKVLSDFSEKIVGSFIQVKRIPPSTVPNLYELVELEFYFDFSIPCELLYRYGRDKGESNTRKFKANIGNIKQLLLKFFKVIYFEPSVLVAPSTRSAKHTLALWMEYAESDGGIVKNALSLPDADVQKTLVIIKPDNFRFPSSRPGNIIDLFSRSGLRIVGAQVHRMSMAEAKEFYGPVQPVLREKLCGRTTDKACAALEREFHFPMPAEVKEALTKTLGPYYGDQQFYEIMKFMTGVWLPDVPEKEMTADGKVRCLALIYAGKDAVDKIRNILGPTDPSKANPGSVRKEYGSDIMVNAAHASDSAENAQREIGIIKPERNLLKQWFDKYYA